VQHAIGKLANCYWLGMSVNFGKLHRVFDQNVLCSWPNAARLVKLINSAVLIKCADWSNAPYNVSLIFMHRLWMFLLTYLQRYVMLKRCQRQ